MNAAATNIAVNEGDGFIEQAGDVARF